MADPPKKPPKGSEETLRDLGYAPNLPPAISTHDPPTVAGSGGGPVVGNLPRMGGGESVRETIKRSIRETEAAMAKSAAPNSDWQSLADKAVLGICELLGLLLGLPFGENLYHGNAITGWHLFYLVIGVVFAGAGPMFPWVRTRTWVPKSVSASLSRRP